MGYSHIYSPRTVDYLIKKNGSIIEGIDGKTGFIIKTDPDFKTIFDYLMTLIPSGTDFKTTSTIHIGAGDYSLSDTITIDKHNVNVVGNGYSHNYGPVRITLANGVDDTMLELDANYITLTNLMLSGNKANNANGHIIHGSATTTTTKLMGCVLYQGKERGLYLESGVSSFLYNCELKQCDEYGFYFNSYGNIVNCLVSDNVNGGYTKAGIITNCDFTDNTSKGLFVIRDSIIANNRFYNNTSYQIQIAGDRNIIQTNRIDCNSASNYGIYFASGSNNVIGNNVIENYNTAPIFPSAGAVNSTLNNLGLESANAEEPQLTKWQHGNIVDFTDSGDGSGDGIYIKNHAGNWVKLD